MKDKIQQQIADLVCRLANIPELGAEDDFFDAGLASVQALDLLLEIEEIFAVSLSDDEFTQVRTVHQLTKLVSSAGTQS